VVSAPHRRGAWFPEILAAFDQMSRATLFEPMRQSPLYGAWSQIAPDPGSFPELIDKTGELLRKDYDWSEEIKQLTMPVQLIFGDADSIPPAEVAHFFRRLGGGQRDAYFDGSLPTDSRLAILPGTSHYVIFANPQLAALVSGFTS
jgi:pimeloyl-ACP methyl ester carboxylesterase